MVRPWIDYIKSLKDIRKRMDSATHRFTVCFLVALLIFPIKVSGWELITQKDSFTDRESIFLRQASVSSDKGEFVLGCVTNADGSRSAKAYLVSKTVIPLGSKSPLEELDQYFRAIPFQVRLGDVIRKSSGDPLLNQMGVAFRGEDLLLTWNQVLRGDGRIRVRLMGSKTLGLQDSVMTFDFNGLIQSADAQVFMRECPILQRADRKESEKIAEARAKEAATQEKDRRTRVRSEALGQYMPKSFVDDFYKNIVKPVSTDNRSLNRKAQHIRDNAGYERGPDKAQNSVDMAVSFSLNADGTASDVRYVVTGRSTRLDEELDGFRIKPFFEALRTKPITSIPPPELVGRQFTAWISFCDLFRCKEYERVAGARLFGIEKKGLHLVEFSGMSNYWPLNDLPKNHHEYLFRPTELVKDAAF